MSETTAVRLVKKEELAPRWHTLVLVAAILLPVILRNPVALGAAAQQPRANLLLLYFRTIALEWALFGFVWYGLWKNGRPLELVTGRRWKSLSDAARDLGIGVGVLFSAIVISSLVASVVKNMGPGGRNLLPHAPAEIAVWLVLSVTAGIVEETVYRGYLQAQFQCLGLSVSLAVAAQALLFGFVHAYQGWPHAVSIGLLGLVAGVVTEWRRSVRPTMIGHALQDILGALHA
jgi:membrane protease YdiL (CAAX protease family)